MADQLISTAVHDKLPESYVRTGTERPRLDEVVPDAHIPVVDLADPDRATVVAQIGAACRSHGFFQVLNHGLPAELTPAAMAVAHEFFRLSPEEKTKLYSDDPSKKMRPPNSFNVGKETLDRWRNYLRLHCHPLEQFGPNWPANPPPFREISTYCREVGELSFRLCAAISESLRLEEDYIIKLLGEQEQHMAVNFYPKCPEPELTYGLPAHLDPNALTILLMDQQVAGLQVLKEGKWTALNPRRNALGDQLQVAEGQPSVAGGDKVSTREAWARTDKRSSTKLKEHLRLSLLEITTATGVLINLFYIGRATEPISENPSLIAASASAFISLLSGYGLMLNTMRQLMSHGNYPPCSWSKHLLCLSIVSLAFTVVVLIASFFSKV